MEGLILPPGTRFLPTDEELIKYYLMRKMSGLPVPPGSVKDIDVYSTEPWNLPVEFRQGDENLEAYCFTPRKLSISKGRTWRRAGSGLWHAKNTRSPVMDDGRIIGSRTSLTFKWTDFTREPDNEWIMHEFVTGEEEGPSAAAAVCRIYKKERPTSSQAIVETGPLPITLQELLQRLGLSSPPPFVRRRPKELSATPATSLIKRRRPPKRRRLEYTPERTVKLTSGPEFFLLQQAPQLPETPARALCGQAIFDVPSSFSPSKVLAPENQYQNVYTSSSYLESALPMEFCAPENHPIQEIQALEDESPRKRRRQESTLERAIQLAPSQEFFQESSTALSLLPPTQQLVLQPPPSFPQQLPLQETPTVELPIQAAPQAFSFSPGEVLAPENQHQDTYISSNLYLEPVLMKSYVPEQFPVQETPTVKPSMEIVGQASPLNNAQENQYLDLCEPSEYYFDYLDVCEPSDYYSEYLNLQPPVTAEENMFTTFQNLPESHCDHPIRDLDLSSRIAYQSYSDNPIPDMGTQRQNQYLSDVDYLLSEPDKASYFDHSVVDLDEASQVSYQSHSDNSFPDQGTRWNMFPDQGSTSKIPFLESENPQQDLGAAGQNQLTYDTRENYEFDYELDCELVDYEFVDSFFS